MPRPSARALSRAGAGLLVGVGTGVLAGLLRGPRRVPGDPGTSR